MSDSLPNNSDGWVAPTESPYLDDAAVLFLWKERVDAGRVKVWFDEHGVLHFKAIGHPGCTLNPPRIGGETIVVPA